MQCSDSYKHGCNLAVFLQVDNLHHAASATSIHLEVLSLRLVLLRLFPFANKAGAQDCHVAHNETK
eukprot:5322230-Amphidinium_carterae.1